MKLRLLFLVLSAIIISTSTIAQSTLINDNCTTAIAADFDFNGDADTTMIGSFLGATFSGEPGCPYFNTSPDLWFSVLVPTSGIFEVKEIYSELGGLSLSMYRGSCGSSLVQLFVCGPLAAFGGLTFIPGETIYVQIWDHDTASATGTDFELAFQDPSGCEDVSVPPTNLYPISFSWGAVNFTWDLVPESIGCQIRGKFLGSGAGIKKKIIQFQLGNRFFDGSLMPMGAGDFTWQVRCACSLPPNPVLLTDWSVADTFYYTNPKMANPELNFDLLPNPASEFVLASLKSDHLGKFLLIYDMLGNEMLQLTVTGMQQRIDISHLTGGVYFLIVEGENYAKRFVVE